MLFRLAFVLSSVSLAVVIACGSSGSSHPLPDAHTGGSDAKVFLDAPSSSGLTGLGQKCGTGQPACPTNASQCIGFTQGGPTYCTPTCLTGGAGSTNGSGQFAQGSITPPPNTATCTAAYTGGTVGTAACDIIAATTPADNPLKASTAYTAISFVCSVNCGTGSGTGPCPTGMTCQTGNLAGLCLPN
jgi:hypothetical protein